MHMQAHAGSSIIASVRSCIHSYTISFISSTYPVWKSFLQHKQLNGLACICTSACASVHKMCMCKPVWVYLSYLKIILPLVANDYFYYPKKRCVICRWYFALKSLCMLHACMQYTQVYCRKRNACNNKIFYMLRDNIL